MAPIAEIGVPRRLHLRAVEVDAIPTDQHPCLDRTTTLVSQAIWRGPLEPHVDDMSGQ